MTNFCLFSWISFLIDELPLPEIYPENIESFDRLRKGSTLSLICELNYNAYSILVNPNFDTPNPRLKRMMMLPIPLFTWNLPQGLSENV